MAWTKLGSTVLDATNNNIIVEFTPKNYLYVLAHILPSGVITSGVRFNDDSTASYTYMRVLNGGSAGSEGGLSYYAGASIRSEAERGIITMYIQNKDSTEKLIVSDLVFTAGTVPDNPVNRQSAVGKYTESDQIEKIDIVNQDAGTFYNGSELSVFGRD